MPSGQVFKGPAAAWNFTGAHLEEGAGVAQREAGVFEEEAHVDAAHQLLPLQRRVLQPPPLRQRPVHLAARLQTWPANMDLHAAICYVVPCTVHQVIVASRSANEFPAGPADPRLTSVIG